MFGKKRALTSTKNLPRLPRDYGCTLEKRGHNYSMAQWLINTGTIRLTTQHPTFYPCTLEVDNEGTIIVHFNGQTRRLWHHSASRVRDFLAHHPKQDPPLAEFFPEINNLHIFGCLCIGENWAELVQGKLLAAYRETISLSCSTEPLEPCEAYVEPVVFKKFRNKP